MKTKIWYQREDLKQEVSTKTVACCHKLNNQNKPHH